MAGIVFSEGSGVNESVFGKSQYPIRSFLKKEVEAFEEQSVIKYLCTVEKSTHFAEKYGGMTGMQQWGAVGEGGAAPANEMQEGYSRIVENITFKSEFAITAEMVEDSVTHKLTEKPTEFVQGYGATKEYFVAQMFGEALKKSTSFKTGVATVPVTSADGLSLFNVAHPSIIKKTSTQSNCFADAFSPDALAAAETAMQNFKGDNGRILTVVPDTIVIPNDYVLKKAVFAAIGADKDPNTANNGFNYLFGRWRVIIVPYLNEFITAGTRPWILLSSQRNKLASGAIFQQRKDMTIRSYINDSTDDNVWHGRARFGGGFNDWRFAAAGGITGGTQLVTA